MAPFPEGRYATYVDLAHCVRAQFTSPSATLRELFGRISFNILCSNTDDHGRNHAALIEADGLVLSPAYDICPQARSGTEARQAMAFGPDGERGSRVALLIDAAGTYLLDRQEAAGIVEAQIEVITAEWREVCDLAELTALERNSFRGRQFLNPFALS
jgi:serine/threonine-protein kinase HipA